MNDHARPDKPGATASVTLPPLTLPELTIHVGDAVRLAGSEFIWIAKAVYPSRPDRPVLVECDTVRFCPARQEIVSVTRQPAPVAEVA